MTQDDFAAIAAMLAEDEAAFHGRPSHISATDVRDWASQVDLEKSSWLLDDADGVLATGWAWTSGDSDVAVAIGVVAQRAKGRGYGAQLVEWSERFGRDSGKQRMHQFALGPDTRAAELFASRGYRDVRHFYDMAIELDAAPDVPDVVIETLDESQARAFYEALDEAFQDHWEHHSRGFDEWWTRHSGNPSFDPSLWFFIRDGDEIAATIRNEANRNGGGYVAALGVRRAYRGKGYAKTLLLRTFREFWDRGTRRVTLGVDAASPTGATHLYERVGMHVEAENVVWEKALTQ